MQRGGAAGKPPTPKPKTWKPLYILGIIVALAIALGSCGVVIFAIGGRGALDEPEPTPIPSTAEEYNLVGRELGEDGKYEEAIENFSQAIYLDPELASAYFNRGITYNRTAEYQKAIEDFGRAIVLYDDDDKKAAAYANRAIAHALLGKDVEADADVERAAELGFDRQALVERIEGIRLSR